MIKVVTHTPQRLVLTQGKFSLAIKGTLFCLPFTLFPIYAILNLIHLETLACDRFSPSLIQCRLSKTNLLGVQKSAPFNLQAVEVFNNPKQSNSSDRYSLILTANSPQSYPQNFSIERLQVEQYKSQINTFLANPNSQTLVLREQREAEVYFWLGLSFLGGILGLYRSWCGKLICTLVLNRDEKLLKIQKQSALKVEKRSLPFAEIAEVIVEKKRVGGEGNISSRLVLKLKSQESMEPFEKLFAYNDNEEEIAKLIRQCLSFTTA